MAVLQLSLVYHMVLCVGRKPIHSLSFPLVSNGYEIVPFRRKSVVALLVETQLQIVNVSNHVNLFTWFCNIIDLLSQLIDDFILVGNFLLHVFLSVSHFHKISSLLLIFTF